MNTKLIQMLKAQIAELEIFVEFTSSDDTAALQNFSSILTETRERFEKVSVDERPKCDECGERMNPHYDNELCVSCEDDLQDELQTREDGYQAYINR